MRSKIDLTINVVFVFKPLIGTAALPTTQPADITLLATHETRLLIFLNCLLLLIIYFTRSEPIWLANMTVKASRLHSASILK